MAVTYQGAVDTMIAYLDAHPETEANAYADALAELLLNAIRRQPGRGRGPARNNGRRTRTERADLAILETRDRAIVIRG